MDGLKALFSARDIESLQHESHTPLYHQMYMLLKKSICNGTLTLGTQLPTEYQLADAFNVSRITAKRALDDLSAEGLVERRRGKGTHVIYKYQTPSASQPPIIDDLHDIETIARQSDVRVIDASFRHAPADVKGEFDTAENELLFQTVRVRSKDGRPFAHYTSWTKGLDLPRSSAENMSSTENVSSIDGLNHTEDSSELNIELLRSKPRLEILRNLGIYFDNIEQTLSAVIASSPIADELEIEPGQALLSLTRRSYGTDGKLIDRLDALYHPERFCYKINIKPEPMINSISAGKKTMRRENVVVSEGIDIREPA